MPFKSKSQWKLCYALQKQGKGWNCDEWKKGVKYSSLPQRSGTRSRSTRSRSRSGTRRSTRKSRSRSNNRRSRSRK